MENRATSSRVARSAEVDRLVDQLGDWAAGTGPRFRRLARAIAAAVERGEQPRGARLPAERALTAALGVSRGVVAAAYDELLGDGLVERRHGSGTFVAASLDPAPPPGREGSALVARLVERSRSHAEVVDLSISVLHDADGLPDVSVRTGDLVGVEPDSGYSPWGLASLRTALAAELAEAGLPSTADQVVVTTGAQQGLAAAIACWVRPGDVVVTEDPTYPGALAALAAAGAVVRGVPVDRDGVILAPLAAALADRPALVYLQPALHSPTGAVLSAHRHRAVADLVAEARVPLVEDHALAGLVWSPPATTSASTGRSTSAALAPVLPAIAALAPDHPIAVLGSLSKRWWGGLRVGFVRAPTPVAGRIARVKATQDLGSSVVAQALALRLLTDAATAGFVARRNTELRRRYDALASALAADLPTWSWAEPRGGLSIWVRLPAPLGPALGAAALRHGVAIATADALSPAPSSTTRDRIRLSFALPVDQLVEGVARLAAAWHEVAP